MVISCTDDLAHHLSLSNTDERKVFRVTGAYKIVTITRLRCELAVCI